MLSVIVFCTVRYVCLFLKDQIFVNFVRFKFLTMIIYEVLYALSRCLRYTICSAWFLKIISVRTSVSVFVCLCVCVCVSVCVCVCLCVCVSTLRLLIASGMMWHDMDPCNWLYKLYSCYMGTVVIIVNGHGLGIGMHCTH